MNITDNEKVYLLNLARKALEFYFEYGNTLDIRNLEVSDALKEKRACFVTLSEHGELRGCIGKLRAVNPLFIDVVENVYSAAFKDGRFSPLSKLELPAIKIEISVLDVPEKFKYDSVESLAKYLDFNKPGVIIEHGLYRATFLPQVWEQLPESHQFLSHLCQKAGLPQWYWQGGKLQVFTYGVEKFEEEKSQ